jgi:dipeptidyl aminopeptidase/acylaminoacyl peptidase
VDREQGRRHDPIAAAPTGRQTVPRRSCRITTPLMVFRGANDVRVPQAESDAIVSSLRARGVDVDYRIYDDEGHLFSDPENLVDMFSAAGRFFAEHLGGRP